MQIVHINSIRPKPSQTLLDLIHDVVATDPDWLGPIRPWDRTLSWQSRPRREPKEPLCPQSSRTRRHCTHSPCRRKIIPASRARWMIRIESDSFVGPPNIIVPKQISETLTPARPSDLYSIIYLSQIDFLDAPIHQSVIVRRRRRDSKPDSAVGRISKFPTAP